MIGGFCWGEWGGAALEEDWDEGVGAGWVALMRGWEKERILRNLFDSILMTIEHMFGSLFLCSRRKTSIRPAPTSCFGTA